MLSLLLLLLRLVAIEFGRFGLLLWCRVRSPAAELRWTTFSYVRVATGR